MSNLWQWVKHRIGKEAAQVIENSLDPDQMKAQTRAEIEKLLTPLQKQAIKGMNDLHIGVLARMKKAGLPDEAIRQVNGFLISEKSHAIRGLDTKQNELLDQVF